MDPTDFTKFDRCGSKLVFLISLPRSGSTLLQKMLARHTAIHTTAEPWLMLHPVYALKDAGIETEYEANFARRALQENFLAGIPEGEELYLRALRELAATLYSRALELSGKPVFLDKTPRYFNIIPELYRIFPKAKFVILRRNPAAVVSSILKTWFKNDGAKFRADPHYRDIVRGIRLMNAGVRQLGPQAITVGYEDLVADPGKTLSDLCCRLDLVFDPDMLAYSGKEEPRSRFGDQTNVFHHAGAVDEYVDAWQTNLSTRRLRSLAAKIITELGAAEIEHWGYSYSGLLEKLEPTRPVWPFR